MKSLSLLILSLVLTSCTLAQTHTATIPAELAGKWYTGSTSSLAFLNRTTGIANAAGGNGASIEIMANGSFTKAIVMKTGLYGCSTIAFNYQSGKVKLAADTITFDGAENFISYKDSCNPQTNSEKNKAPLKREYQYELKKDDEGRQLLCFSGGAQEECFVKSEKE